MSMDRAPTRATRVATSPGSSEKMSGISPATPPRLAVFGGTFDPVHNGHLLLAGEIVRAGLASEVLFVPVGQPPHKSAAVLAPAADRLAMLEAALRPYPEFSVSDVETRRTDGPSYTIETLESLGAAFPGCELVFFMGMDSLVELHTWYRATELVGRYRLLTYPRPGVRPPSYAVLAARFGGRNAARLLSDVVADASQSPVSATAIRHLAAAGRSLAGLVPESVLDYIRTHAMYRQAASGSHQSTSQDAHH
jgi:nicotinate-nucleotide adenylyltransferase